MVRVMHGMSKHRLYHCWKGEKDRCQRPTHCSFKDYGERGISFSAEFENIHTWIEYVLSLDDAEKEGYSIDRIDNNGNYERGNLRWSSKSTQTQNTRLLHRHNKTGYRGVSIIKKAKNKKFLATYKIKGKAYRIGSFFTAIEAAEAWNKKIIEIGGSHTLNDLSTGRENVLLV